MADLGRNRFDAIDALIAGCLTLLTLTACSGDSTSPTPVLTAITVTGGGAQSATVGTAVSSPIVAKVTDQSGNPISGIIVTFTPAAASGSASAAQVTTDATGTASVTWTLGTVAGTDSMTVTAGSLTPATVVASATPGAAATLTIIAGNNQAAPIDSTLSTTLEVKVADQYGNAIPNAVVSWSDDAGGMFSTTSTLTDANGIAQVQYTLGPTPGHEDIVASIAVSGASMTAAFTETGN
jgi:protocatechuate 3,4-dioxygenase beta subunit